MLKYPPRYPDQCECGRIAGRKYKSPHTGLFICKACHRRYNCSTQAQYLDDLERNHQANLAAKRIKEKAKRNRKKMGMTNPTGSLPFDTPEFRTKQASLPGRKKRLRENATPSELRIKQILDEANVRYIFQKGFIAYKYYCIVDFYLPGRKVCLEIDGGYHLTTEQKAKDTRKDTYLMNTRGMRVCRITNQCADNITAAELLHKIDNCR